ncbi:MAG: EamA family transporter [Chloroflexi bacterium]|jgi:drug/metabolite transporter (DMT)-like permease|nr:EamA family transporter [Chloroflexota bacterium]MBT4514056.1 EamA family transporter [Chloroflexota bacterium]MBT6683201.1 EamA family transporter [Chloroflexota bacterium]
MTGATIALVLLSALAHASWNFLIKRADDAEVFTWWMAVSINVILLPLGVVLFWLNPPDGVGWLFLAATWILHLGYFITLSRAYRDGDLSLVYPVARGTGLMLIPLSGVLLLDETMSGLAVLGVISVASGIFTLSWWGRFRSLMSSPFSLLRAPGIAYALTTGLIIAAYSTVDKQGVQHVTPLLYMYLMTTSATFGLLPFIARGKSRATFISEWRNNAIAIIAGGMFQFAAYGMVLTALTVSRVSYVGPFREVGLLVGVGLGVFVLKEQFPGGRLFGAALVAIGATAIAIAP